MPVLNARKLNTPASQLLGFSSPTTVVGLCQRVLQQFTVVFQESRCSSTTILSLLGISHVAELYSLLYTAVLKVQAIGIGIGTNSDKHSVVGLFYINSVHSVETAFSNYSLSIFLE